jgi:ribonuclease P protein component
MSLLAIVDPGMTRADLAFAVPRSHGPAVRRNRTRRRLRAVCRELDRSGDMAAGIYLLSPRGSIEHLDARSLRSEILSNLQALVGHE